MNLEPLVDPPERVLRFPAKNSRQTNKPRRRILLIVWAFFYFSLSNDYNMENVLPTNSVNIWSPPVDSNNEMLVDPFSRIALMGQFNYGKLPIDSLLEWRNTLNRYGNFADIAIRGAFWGEQANQTVQTLLSEYDIDIHPSPKTPNEGYFAPYLNMAAYMKKIQQSSKSGVVDGVLYLHDDAMPNLKILKTIFQRTKNHAVIGTDLGRRDHRKFGRDGSYENSREIQNKRKWYADSKAQEQDSTKGRQKEEESDEEWNRRMSLNHYRIYPFGRKNKSYRANGTMYTDVFGNVSYSNFKDLESSLNPWPGGTRDSKICHWGQESFALDPEAWPYLEVDDPQSWILGQTTTNSEITYQDFFLNVPSYTQADFLYIPLKYTDVVVDMSRLLYKHNIWIECAFPMIIDQISRKTGKTSNESQTSQDSIISNNNNHGIDSSAVALPLCTNHWSERKFPFALIKVCEAWWHDDHVRGNLPPYYSQYLEGTAEYNVTQHQQNLEHKYAVYHPIKIGRNASEWKEVMKLINGE